MTNYARSSQTDPRKLLAARQLARRRLLDFTTYTYSLYQPEAAHGLIAATLEGVLDGEIKKLMIFAPPQHGKTELASVRFPAFWCAKRPEDPIILTSYGADLAVTKSGDARDAVQSPEYRTLFPEIALRADVQAKREWGLAGHRGGMRAAGVGGPITGHGAGLGIIDDPFEGWIQAQSSTVRNHVWDWWQGTFRTRVWERGAIILIMTRWHADDLAGRLLLDQGDQWRVLRLPALAESQEERDANDAYLGLPAGQPDPLGRAAGEPLCPERFSREALGAIKRDVGEMKFGAEYQGVPRPAEGNRFKREWFRIVEAAPAEARRVRYWDNAGSEGEGDYTVGVLMALAGGVYYVEDVVRGQWAATQRERIKRQTAELDGLKYENRVTIWVEQEPGSSGKDSADATIRNLAGFPVYKESVSGDKVVRAEPLIAQAGAGNLALVRAAWNQAYIEELCAFPTGAHDDQVDGSSGAFNKLSSASGQNYLEWLRRRAEEAKANSE